VTLLASEANGDEVEMFTDESSMITCELLIEIEYVVVEPQTLRRPFVFKFKLL
jgi:hypothetical protein